MHEYSIIILRKNNSGKTTMRASKKEGEKKIRVDF